MKFKVAMDCYIKKDNEVLLIHRKPDLEKFPDFYMGPGGAVEEDETVIRACEREVEEETGLDIENVKLRIVGTHAHPYRDEVWVVFIFIADYKSGTERASHEGDLEWVKISEVPKLKKIFPDLKYYWPYVFKSENQVRYGYMLYPKSGVISKHEIT
ncbi:NUDIX domain-containing protein [Patescibacteria group bacterium]